jgi:hypothetical protein
MEASIASFKKKLNLLSYDYVEKLPYLKFGFGWAYFLVHFTMARPMSTMISKISNYIPILPCQLG